MRHAKTTATTREAGGIMTNDDSAKKESEGGDPGGSSLIASKGDDAARAYVGPTAVPVSPTVPMDQPKVKVTDPRRVAATMKISRSAVPNIAGGPKPGSIDTPERLPAGAFQPIAVDPELVQEWMARRSKGAEAPPPAVGEAANDTGDTSRWATTEKIEKIDRSALPSSFAPKADVEPAPEALGEKGEEAGAKTAGPGARSIWLPVIVTVSIGLVVGLLVIKFVLLPSAPSISPSPSVVTPGPSAVVSVPSGRVEMPVPEAPSAIPEPSAIAPEMDAPEPSGEPSAVQSSVPPLPSVSAVGPSQPWQAAPPSPFPGPAPKPLVPASPAGGSTVPKPPATTQPVPPAPSAPSTGQKPNVIF